MDPALRSGLLAQERFFEILPADSAVDLRGPLVSRGAEPPGAPLSQNYITFLRTASFDDILNERLPTGFPAEGLDALLYLLLRHSVLLAYATTARRILVRKGRLPNQPYREPVLVDIVGGAAPDPTPTLLRAATADATLRLEAAYADRRGGAGGGRARGAPREPRPPREAPRGRARVGS